MQTGRGELSPLDASNASSVVRFGQRPGRLDQEARGSAQASRPGPAPARAHGGPAALRPARQGVPGDAGEHGCARGLDCTEERAAGCVARLRSGVRASMPHQLRCAGVRSATCQMQAEALRAPLQPMLVRTGPAGARAPARRRKRSSAVPQGRCARADSPPHTGSRLSAAATRADVRPDLHQQLPLLGRHHGAQLHLAAAARGRAARPGAGHAILVQGGGRRRDVQRRVQLPEPAGGRCAGIG